MSMCVVCVSPRGGGGGWCGVGVAGPAVLVKPQVLAHQECCTALCVAVIHQGGAVWAATSAKAKIELLGRSMNAKPVRFLQPHPHDTYVPHVIALGVASLIRGAASAIRHGGWTR